MDDDLPSSHPGNGVCSGADHHYGTDATAGKRHVDLQHAVVLALCTYLSVYHRYPRTYYP